MMYHNVWPYTIKMPQGDIDAVLVYQRQRKIAIKDYQYYSECCA